MGVIFFKGEVILHVILALLLRLFYTYHLMQTALNYVINKVALKRDLRNPKILQECPIQRTSDVKTSQRIHVKLRGLDNMILILRLLLRPDNLTSKFNIILKNESLNSIILTQVQAMFIQPQRKYYNTKAQLVTLVLSRFNL